MIYGFEKEVVQKYSRKTFHHIVSCFNVLPLCAILNKEVFVVHGGLSRMKKFQCGTSVIFIVTWKYRLNLGSTEEQIMQDLLWSDPSDNQGVEENSRGAGALLDQTLANFLKTNNFKTIVRSHELVDDGYDIMHDDQCYTLFSASNYCGDAGNDGAIMVFPWGIHWNHHPSEIHPYSAPRLDVEKGQTMAEIEEAERQSAKKSE